MYTSTTLPGILHVDLGLLMASIKKNTYLSPWNWGYCSLISLSHIFTDTDPRQPLFSFSSPFHIKFHYLLDTANIQISIT